MTNEDRKAKIAELRAEADRLEREGIMAKAVTGALFRSYGRIVLIPPSYPNTYALALTGDVIGCQCYGWHEDPSLEYLGHARDLLAIKAPDAPDTPEPTGMDLVGKVCEFSDIVGSWGDGTPHKCTGYDLEQGYECSCGSWSKFARLYREDRP